MPLFVRLVTVQSPVSVQVQPASIVTTALSETAAPPSALSAIWIVPLKLLPFFSVRFSVEIVSTRMLPVNHVDLRAVAADELPEVVTVRFSAFVVPPPVV